MFKEELNHHFLMNYNFMNIVLEQINGHNDWEDQIPEDMDDENDDDDNVDELV